MLAMVEHLRAGEVGSFRGMSGPVREERWVGENVRR